MILQFFLFAKQIVDMFYKLQILDYGMVILMFVLIIYKIIKDKTYYNIKERIEIIDFAVLGLTIIYFAAFIRNTSGYAAFFKIESAFMIYLLGRLYGCEISKNGYLLAIAGYVVIYLNLIVRFVHFDYKNVSSNLNDGGMYYYKNDLAVGVILATIFIYFYGKNKYAKWITIIPIASYLVFYSNARMQQPILTITYLLFIIFEIKKRNNKTEYSVNLYKVLSLLFIIVLVLFLIFIQFFNFDKYEDVINATATWECIVERILHLRQVYWFDTLHYFSEQTIWRRIIGFDLASISEHNIMNDRSHSEYVNHLYATGYLGTFMILFYWKELINKITSIKDTNLRRLETLLIIFFLISGLTIESLELTQMSWFVFLFAGVTITEESRQNRL